MSPRAPERGRRSNRKPRAASARSRRSPESDPTGHAPGFSRRDGALFCESAALTRIAADSGTPTYVYSAAGITAAYRELDRAIGRLPHTLCYAVKANSNLSILRLLAKLGSGFDIVSGGELYRLEHAGISGSRAVFSGVGKSREEIREALRARIRLFNVESESELELLSTEAARLGHRAPAAIRVNPDVAAGGHPHISTGRHQHKFGVDWADARRLYLQYRDSPWIEWQGISAHLGSQILSVAPFERGLRRLAGYVAELRRAGITLRYLDFGGGLGVRYAHEQPPGMRAYARAITRIVRPLRCHLLLEPGRAIVASAGVLLTRVLYTKRNRGKTFVVVDAAMNDFMRPALYGAVHPMTPVNLAAGNESTARVDVVGPVCETGDCFLHDWPLGEVSPGDLLVLWGAGAYGFVEASNYNSRPRPAEVLVDGARVRIARRRESRAELVRGE
ncbi:MAG TPA: diaminopimelate decarboxylase [Candidatus Acidoferrales bacterium]